MPRKAYVAHLKELGASSGVEGISDVCSGDDDGEFRFKVADGSGSQYEISALIPGMFSIPSIHQ
jgi:hypothetical protein